MISPRIVLKSQMYLILFLVFNFFLNVSLFVPILEIGYVFSNQI